jgi:DNA-binding IclR family transcriptional regulator
MALDMPKPTLLCYLSTLEDSGLVSRTGEKYELGFKMAMFWASYRTTQKEKIEDIQGLLKQLEIDDEQ